MVATMRLLVCLGRVRRAVVVLLDRRGAREHLHGHDSERVRNTSSSPYALLRPRPAVLRRSGLAALSVRLPHMSRRRRALRRLGAPHEYKHKGAALCTGALPHRKV